MIRVVLVDDHPVVRAGIRAVLQKAEDVLVAAEGGDGAEALRLAREYRPDVLVLDINLPDMTGLAVARQLGEEGLHLNILILTLHSDAKTVFETLEAGARGYVLKDEALESLAKAVRAVARGDSWLSPSVAGKVVRRAVDGKVMEPAQPELPVDLTPRELDVLKLLAQGLDNETIAETLVLTKRTIQNHVSNIYGKLGTSSRTEAMLFAIQHGLVDIPSGGKDSDGA
jgi:DNA-binding NarL/FixJ family response regulator